MADNETRVSRPEIFLLRGVAVLVILVHHLWPGRMPGGFAALDVFFVISGYLVTGILIGMRTRTGRIELAPYLARRARRILPSATVVLLACLAGMFVFTSIGEWGRVAGEILASATFAENWALIVNDIAYTGSDTASPVQHYWTLAVEAQFYVLWPLLLMLLLGRRGVPRRRAAAIGIGTVFLLSLAASIVWCTVAPTTGYLSTATRFWELAAGGLLAVLVTRIPPLRVGAPLAAAGWLLIGGSFAFLHTGVAWPGYLALIPVAGAALVIAAGVPVTPPLLRRLTDNALTRTLADSSYAIYLWHWPILVFADRALGQPPSTPQKLLIVAVSLLLGWLTTMLVERPIRFGPAARARAGATLAVAALVIAIVALPAAAVRQTMLRTGELYAQVAVAGSAELCRGAEALTPGADCIDGPYPGLTPDPLGEWEVVSVLHGMGCATDNVIATVKPCVWGDPEGEVRVALVGDSHGMKLWPAMKLLAEAEGWRLVTYFRAQCEFTSPTMDGTDGCREWRADVATALAENGPWDAVMTTGASHATDRPGAPEALRATWQPLIDAGAEVVVVRDVPYLTQEVRTCLLDDLDDVAACDAPRAGALLPDVFASTAEGLDGAAVIDLTDRFCDETTCFAVVGGIITHRDGNHITDAYSRTLAPTLGERLRMAVPSLFR